MTVKWGIIGTGKIAGKFATDMAAVDDSEIVAVGTRNPLGPSSFAAQFNIPKVHDYEGLINDPEVDIIYISTPHHLHYENTMSCLRKGKPVLCEKPVAVNAPQFQEMIRCAKEHDVLMMEALWTYFLPAIHKAKEWIDKGGIGKVQAIRAEFGFKAPFDPDKRLFNPELAGGALLDVGIYPVALCGWVIDEPIASLNAVATPSPTGVDGYNATVIRYESGVVANLSSSLTTQLINEGIIYGEEGYIRLPKFWMANQAELVLADGHRELFDDGRKTTGYDFEIRHINELVRTGQKESPLVPLSKSLEHLQILDRIRDQIGLVYPFEK